MAVEVFYETFDGDVVLPQFRPAGGGMSVADRTTVDWRTVQVGDGLPELVLPDDGRPAWWPARWPHATSCPCTTTRLVRQLPGRAGDLHEHLLRRRLLLRLLTDWAGPDAMLRRLAFRLGVPAFAGSVLTLRGTVSAIEPDDEGASITVEVRAINDLGDHVSGTAVVHLLTPMSSS